MIQNLVTGAREDRRSGAASDPLPASGGCSEVSYRAWIASLRPHLRNVLLAADDCAAGSLFEIPESQPAPPVRWPIV
jgi:hypothetical protein